MSSRAPEGPGAGSASTMPGDDATFIPLCGLRKAMVVQFGNWAPTYGRRAIIPPLCGSSQVRSHPLKMSRTPVAASLPSSPPRLRVEAREDALSPYAVRSRGSRREVPEEPCPIRGEFQRDRDRIVHSKSFRRLKHKTQVFIAPTGDHYVTRLTHTLEVAQIARTISRALDLNEDLTEAIATGARSRAHAVRTRGRERGRQAARRGIPPRRAEPQGGGAPGEGGQGVEPDRARAPGHRPPLQAPGRLLRRLGAAGLSLEGQVCRLSDAVAYLNHDLADAFRAGLLHDGTCPAKPQRCWGPGTQSAYTRWSPTWSRPPGWPVAKRGSTLGGGRSSR